MPLKSVAGQGTIMELFLFCIMFNGVGPSTEPLSVAITHKQETQENQLGRSRKSG